MILGKIVESGSHLHRRFFHISRSLLWNITQCPELDTDYLCNPHNAQEISDNITARKGVGDINLVHELKQKLSQLNTQDTMYESTQKQLYSELLKIPNRTHPEVAGYNNDPKIVKEVGNKPNPDTDLKEFQEITKRLKLVRTDQLGNLSGNKSYYLLGELAELEHALVRYVVADLIKNKFELISVPDILPREVIEGCGMNTRGARTQVCVLTIANSYLV